MGGKADSLVHSARSLRQLTLLRNVAIVGQTFAIAVVHEFFAVPSPLVVLVSVAASLVLFNLAITSWRLRQAKPATDREVLVQIVVDVSGLSVLLYLSGGATNPFAGMFLMPLAIAAARLPGSHAIAVALLTAACYSLLVFFHVPLPAHGPGAQEFQVVAVWINYLICGALITYVVIAVTGRLREQSRRLAEMRQNASAGEYLSRVGSLAAGAAHEMRSPLCTIALLVEEMLDRDDSATSKQHLRVMSDQIEVCRRSLSDLVAGGKSAAQDPTNLPADRFVEGLVDAFRNLRPAVHLSFRCAGPRPFASISTDRDLSRGILNLLHNAADASPQAVEMSCCSNGRELRITIDDRGPGIPAELEGTIGEPLLTTKGKRGTGIGLLLARAAVRRAGGSLSLSSRSGGGTRAEIVVPVEHAAEEHSREATGKSGILTDPAVSAHGWKG